MNEFYNRQFYIRIIMNESCLSHCNKNIEHLNLKFCKKKSFFFPYDSYRYDYFALTPWQ